jgi:signal recognition particle GTPase
MLNDNLESEYTVEDLDEEKLRWEYEEMELYFRETQKTAADYSAPLVAEERIEEISAQIAENVAFHFSGEPLGSIKFEKLDEPDEPDELYYELYEEQENLRSEIYYDLECELREVLEREIYDKTLEDELSNDVAYRVADRIMDIFRDIKMDSENETQIQNLQEEMEFYLVQEIRDSMYDEFYDDAITHVTEILTVCHDA